MVWTHIHCASEIHYFISSLSKTKFISLLSLVVMAVGKHQHITAFAPPCDFITQPSPMGTPSNALYRGLGRPGGHRGTALVVFGHYSPMLKHVKLECSRWFFGRIFTGYVKPCALTCSTLTSLLRPRKIYVVSASMILHFYQPRTPERRSPWDVRGILQPYICC